MNPREYIKMSELEDRYWWFVARRRLVEELVANISARSLSSPTSTRVLPPQTSITQVGKGGLPPQPHGQANQHPQERIRILDAGCGTGANLQMLKRYGEAIGLDSSSQALHISS